MIISKDWSQKYVSMLHFLCLSEFVAFGGTFNNLSCSLQPCGLLSRIQLRLTYQSWQSGPNDFVLHFEVTFVDGWYQNRRLVQVVYLTSSLISPKLHKLTS